MASDQQVSARAVLDAVMELRRQGPAQVIEHLEQVEPELTNYLLESLSQIHQHLMMLGAPSRRTQRVYRQVQAMALVAITALRNGHFELWRHDVGDRIGQFDPHADGSTPPRTDAPPDDAES